MITVKLASLPKCSFCENDAQYDSRTSTGAHAYLCEHHMVQYGCEPTTRIELREKVDLPDPIETKNGILRTELEDAMNDSIVEWECPYCGDIKRLELDATGEVTCDSCTLIYNVEGLI